MADFTAEDVKKIIVGRLEELSNVPVTEGNTVLCETLYAFTNNILNEVEHNLKYVDVDIPDVNEYAEGLDVITHERDDLLDAVAKHRSAPIPF